MTQEAPSRQHRPQRRTRPPAAFGVLALVVLSATLLLPGVLAAGRNALGAPHTASQVEELAMQLKAGKFDAVAAAYNMHEIPVRSWEADRHPAGQRRFDRRDGRNLSACNLAVVDTRGGTTLTCELPEFAATNRCSKGQVIAAVKLLVHRHGGKISRSDQPSDPGTTLTATLTPGVVVGLYLTGGSDDFIQLCVLPETAFDPRALAADRTEARRHDSPSHPHSTLH
jgi:hypothetical protein